MSAGNIPKLSMATLHLIALGWNAGAAAKEVELEEIETEFAALPQDAFDVARTGCSVHVTRDTPRACPVQFSLAGDCDICPTCSAPQYVVQQPGHHGTWPEFDSH
jgi:hypothetical protein